MRVGHLFIIGMLAFGVVAGLVSAYVPAVRALAVPTLVWPLLLGFLVDIALQSLARQGRAEPLTMGERMAGIFGAGVIATLIVALAE
jgi:hypothetical protein